VVWYVNAATARVEPDTLAVYAAVIRRSSTDPWRIHAESPNGHVVAGFESIWCDTRSGWLHVTFSSRNVASAWSQPDETLTQRGILAGPSIADDDMRVVFSRVTPSGIRPVSCASSLVRGDTANVWIGLVGQP
jgi:hypothetical protein